MMVNEQELTDIYKLAETMQKFGPAITILTVFLFIFLAIILYFLKNNSVTSKQLMVQQQQLIDHLLDQQQPKKEEREDTKTYDEKNIVEIFYKLNTCLKAECKKFLEKTKCDRIGIYVFHNGTVASHGLPFFKVSCICEYIRRGTGICSHINDSTNIPLTLFDDIIGKLYTQGSVIVSNKTENGFASDSFFLEKDKADTAIFTVVYDGEDNVMGFVLGEYHDQLEDNDILKSIDIYKELCARLKPVLEFSEYQKISTQ